MLGMLGMFGMFMLGVVLLLDAAVNGVLYHTARTRRRRFSVISCCCDQIHCLDPTPSEPNNNCRFLSKGINRL